jgi:hypothetical protein
MKDAVICLRISKNLRTALERMSETDRRSLSSTVQNILYTHIQERGLQDLTTEKRRYLRKKISAPALLSGPDGAVHAGMVCDISLGGICVAAPRDFSCRAAEDFRMFVVFTLPKNETPLTVQCIPRHVLPGEQVHVGASFIDDGCQTFEAIRRHFVN